MLWNAMTNENVMICYKTVCYGMTFHCHGMRYDTLCCIVEFAVHVLFRFSSVVFFIGRIIHLIYKQYKYILQLFTSAFVASREFYIC